MTGDAFGPGLDDTGCDIMHIDMDAFFASVEIARDPSLRGKPVIVAGLGPRGVVTAASYEARPFGVNSAMPTAVARRRCPHGVFISPSGGEYSRVSKAVRAIFSRYTPLVEPVSVDEAFLDVAGARRLFGSASRIAAAIRDDVRGEHGITCTVGIASTKFVAKLASTQAKPDGLAVVPVGKVIDFLHPLPISALWGVGAATETSLKRLGVHKVGELAHTPLDRLRRFIGTASAEHLHALAWGRDPRTVQVTHVEKSIGAETTFDTDIGEPERIAQVALRLSHKTAARARRAGLVGRTVSVKIRYGDFSTFTRARTLPEPTDVAHEIYEHARDLITANMTAPLRLLGIRLEGLSEARGRAVQPRLGEPLHGWRDVERVVDSMHDRFGTTAIGPASLLDPASRKRRRPDDGTRSA
ncbi:DNA polymerase IV [Stackebrandtia soli]